MNSWPASSPGITSHPAFGAEEPRPSIDLKLVCGVALLALGAGLFGFGLFHAFSHGSCSTTGYSAHYGPVQRCPGGIGWWMAVIMAGIIAALAGAGVRDLRRDDRRPAAVRGHRCAVHRARAAQRQHPADAGQLGPHGQDLRGRVRGLLRARRPGVGRVRRCRGVLGRGRAFAPRRRGHVRRRGGGGGPDRHRCVRSDRQAEHASVGGHESILEPGLGPGLSTTIVVPAWPRRQSRARCCRAPPSLRSAPPRSSPHVSGARAATSHGSRPAR